MEERLQKGIHFFRSSRTHAWVFRGIQKVSVDRHSLPTPHRFTPLDINYQDCMMMMMLMMLMGFGVCDIAMKHRCENSECKDVIRMCLGGVQLMWQHAFVVRQLLALPYLLASHTAQAFQYRYVRGHRTPILQMLINEIHEIHRQPWKPIYLRILNITNCTCRPTTGKKYSLYCQSAYIS